MSHASIVIQSAQLPADLPIIYAIRRQVFQQEQQVPAELEFDGQDAAAWHWLAYWDQQAVGTARARSLTPHQVKLERVAILAAYRGRGWGAQLVRAILADLAARQVETVLIHAQVAVQDFYARLGFVAAGSVFEEAGIRHVKMSKRL